MFYHQIPASHGPLARYVKLRVVHAPGMPGTFSPPPWISDPGMHHGTCVTHVPWCTPASLINGFLWSRWLGKRSRHSRCMRNPQFYVSGNRPMDQCSRDPDPPFLSIYIFILIRYSCDIARVNHRSHNTYMSIFICDYIRSDNSIIEFIYMKICINQQSHITQISTQVYINISQLDWKSVSCIFNYQND